MGIKRVTAFGSGCFGSAVPVPRVSFVLFGPGSAALTAMRSAANSRPSAAVFGNGGSV